MNIEEALKRIKELKADVEMCGDLVSMTRRDASRGELSSGEIVILAAKYDQRRVRVPLSDFIDLLNLRREKAQAEMNRLQPVVDMANLALKGLINE